MPGYVLGNFLVYSMINAFTPGSGNILALNTVTHYRLINTILAVALLECVYNILK